VIKEDNQIQTNINFNNSEFETIITKKQKHQYKLIHQRFEHYKPNILKKLYKVISIKKPIRILLLKRKICPTCKLAKIKNLIKKNWLY